MSISLTIYNFTYAGTARSTWWENFTETTREEYWATSMKFVPSEYIKLRDQKLLEYKSRFDGDSVHFDDSESATIFLLRWS